MRAITVALGLGAALAFSVGPTLACPEGDHVHEERDARHAEPQVPLSPPSRPLVWGDVNIIHTTDSHGWLLGHQKPSFPEPNYRCVWARLYPNYPRALRGITHLAAWVSISKVGTLVILRPSWRT